MFALRTAACLPARTEGCCRVIASVGAGRFADSVRSILESLPGSRVERLGISSDHLFSVHGIRQLFSATPADSLRQE